MPLLASVFDCLRGRAVTGTQEQQQKSDKVKGLSGHGNILYIEWNAIAY
jgi:hypothetical protein